MVIANNLPSSSSVLFFSVWYAYILFFLMATGISSDLQNLMKANIEYEYWRHRNVVT